MRWLSGYSVRFAVGKPGVQSPCRVIPKKTLKMAFSASLFGAWHLEEVAENKLASSLVVSLGKTLNGTPPPLCGKLVAQTPRKWQFPSECGHPVQNIAI